MFITIDSKKDRLRNLRKREGSQKDTESAKVSEKERRTERGMEKVESG